jgi:hypothetical protein
MAATQRECDTDGRPRIFGNGRGGAEGQLTQCHGAVTSPSAAAAAALEGALFDVLAKFASCVNVAVCEQRRDHGAAPRQWARPHFAACSPPALPDHHHAADRGPLYLCWDSSLCRVTAARRASSLCPSARHHVIAAPAADLIPHLLCASSAPASRPLRTPLPTTRATHRLVDLAPLQLHG